MLRDILNDTVAKTPWSVTHPLSQEDSEAVATLRSFVALVKGKLEGTAGRGPFNSIMEQVAAPDGVTFEAAVVGGISGWWAKVARVPEGAAIMYIHGGWFHWGTAQAYRNFVGHIALSAGTDAFIPEYRLAAHITPISSMLFSPWAARAASVRPASLSLWPSGSQPMKSRPHCSTLIRRTRRAAR